MNWKLFFFSLIFPLGAFGQTPNVEITVYSLYQDTFEIHSSFGQYPYSAQESDGYGLLHQLIITPTKDTIYGFPAKGIEIVQAIEQIDQEIFIAASLDVGQIWKYTKENTSLVYKNKDYGLEVMEGAPLGFYAIIDRMEVKTLGFVNYVDHTWKEVYLTQPIPTIINRAEQSEEGMMLFGYNAFGQNPEIKVGSYTIGEEEIALSDEFRENYISSDAGKVFHTNKGLEFTFIYGNGYNPERLILPQGRVLIGSPEGKLLPINGFIEIGELIIIITSTDTTSQVWKYIHERDDLELMYSGDHGVRFLQISDDWPSGILTTTKNNYTTGLLHYSYDWENRTRVWRQVTFKKPLPFFVTNMVTAENRKKAIIYSNTNKVGTFVFKNSKLHLSDWCKKQLKE